MVEILENPYYICQTYRFWMGQIFLTNLNPFHLKTLLDWDFENTISDVSNFQKKTHCQVEIF